MSDDLIAVTKNTIEEIAANAMRPSADNVIDLELLHNRAASINELLKLKQFLNSAIHVLSTRIDRAKEMQAADIKKIDQAMKDFTTASSWKNKLLTNLPNTASAADTAAAPATPANVPPTSTPAATPSTSVWSRPGGLPATVLKRGDNSADTTADKLEIKAPPGIDAASRPKPQQPGMIIPAGAADTMGMTNAANAVNAVNAPHTPPPMPFIPMHMANPGYPLPMGPLPQFPMNNLSTPTTKIHFSTVIYLDAINVDSIQMVIESGKLYYIPPMDHFAIMINGEVFHGNIGKIYNNQKDPVRVKSCKFGANCNRSNTCTYYHDPLEFSGRKDIRNFAANSWMYVEPSASLRDPARIRRFGSRDNLSIDLPGITKEEIDRFNDQMFHDMLCMLILRKYKK